MTVTSRIEPFRHWIYRATVLLTVAVTGPGCLGPQALRATRMKYNESIRVTNDEQLLMNIVRLRYADSPVFIDLPSITSQFEVGGGATFLGGIGNQFEGRTNLGFGEFTTRDSPTLSYRPREGKEVARTLLTPLSAELFSIVNAGANFEQLMLMTVSEINDVSNAVQATVMVPKAPDQNDEFLRGVRILAGLREREIVEMRLGTAEESEAASDPISIKSLGGSDLLAAAKEGYVYRHRGEGQYTLLKREKGLVLRIRRDFVDSPEMAEVARIFHLRPGLAVYRIQSELSQNALNSPHGVLEDEDTVYFNLRSILQMMIFLSKGVTVPEEHVRTCVVPTTPGPDGQPYDWTRITAGNFVVHSQKHRPRNAEVAISYRDHWYYIAENDVASRSILAILEILVCLEESETRLGGPLLTIPVGG